jgi:signal transduction histidine kinase
MFRTLTSRQLAFDVVTAALCLLLRFAIGVHEVPMFFVVLAMAVALGLRRLSPGLALAVAWVGAIVQVSTGLHPDVSNLAILPVLYATASYGLPQIKWSGLSSAGLGAIVIAVYTSLSNIFYAVQCSRVSGAPCSFDGQVPESLFSLMVIFFFALVVFVLSWTFGLLAKTWRKARESSLARVIAERQRIDAQQDVVVEQERTRIARDMHDVVAHSLAVVIAQADGARYAGKQDPEAVDAALVTIAGTARQALGEVRVLLGQLRHSQGDAPQPTLSDLGQLFAQLRASGLRIEFSESGDPVLLAPGQQLAVYRIVQEALTNALRHGDAAQDVLVRFGWSAASLTVEVSNALLGTNAVADDGAARHDTGQTGTAQPVTAGHGLAGMRERTVLWGGTFEAGPVDGKDYVVKAALPIPEAARDGS